MLRYREKVVRAWMMDDQDKHCSSIKTTKLLDTRHVRAGPQCRIRLLIATLVLESTTRSRS